MNGALAIDVGGTKVAVAIVAADGTVHAERRIATQQPDGQRLFVAILSEARATLASAPDGLVMVGCGVGCGGPMRWPEGVVSPLYIPQWRGFPLRARLEDALGLRSVVDNDAKAMALGEWWRGAGRGTDDMLGMVVSTGVGGGLIVDGRLLDGGRGEAGHIGHVVVAEGGPRCDCGATGCLAAYASGTAIARRYRERVPARVGATAADVAAAARDGDGIAQDIFAAAARALGRAIVSATALCDLDLAVLGGSVALNAWDLLEAELAAEVRSHARLPFEQSLRVARAELGQQAGLVGAGALVLLGPATRPVSA